MICRRKRKVIINDTIRSWFRPAIIMIFRCLHCFAFFLESSPAARSSSLINKQRVGHHAFLEQTNKQQVTQKILSDSTSATGIRLTCLLLTISFIFVICTLPISIRSLIADYLPSQRSTTRWQITQLCLTLLMYFNHTVRHRVFYLADHLRFSSRWHSFSIV